MSSWQAERNPRPAGKPGADGFGFVTEKNACKELWGKHFLVSGGDIRIQNDTNIQPFAMTKQLLLQKKFGVCVCVPSTAGLFFYGGLGVAPAF